MHSSLIISILSLSLLSALTDVVIGETKIPSTEKSLRAFIDKEIALYSTADNTEYTDRMKLAQRVWVSFYKAEAEFATLAKGLPLDVNETLKGSALERNVALMKRELIITRYHDFIYKPTLVKQLPKAAGDYHNPLLQQMESLMKIQQEKMEDAAAQQEGSADGVATVEVSEGLAPFSKQYLLASQYQFFLKQLEFNNLMVMDWLKLKYRQQENFTDILKAKEESDKKWLIYLDAVQHIYAKQGNVSSQEDAYRIGIALLLRRLETVQKQLPFSPVEED